MEQRLSLVTLGVDDLQRSSAFYRELGWDGQLVQDTVFFQAGGLAVVLWSRAALAADLGVGAADSTGTTDDTADGSDPRAFGGIALAHNVRSREEVDAVITAARAAGAQITREPAETFYDGWAGAFRDPDGHCWEIAHNPGFPLADDGSLTVPDLGGDQS